MGFTQLDYKSMVYSESSSYLCTIMEGKSRKVSKTPILRLLAHNVKYYRNQLSLSQEKLAELADLHPTYISNIEQGKRNLSLENVSRIAKALGLTVPELLTEINPDQDVKS